MTTSGIIYGTGYSSAAASKGASNSAQRVGSRDDKISKIINIVAAIAIALGAILLAIGVTFVCLNSTVIGLPLIAVGGGLLLIGLLTFAVQQIKSARGSSGKRRIDKHDAVRYIRTTLTEPQLEEKKIALYRAQEDLKKLEQRKTATEGSLSSLEAQRTPLVSSLDAKTKEIERLKADRATVEDEKQDTFTYDKKEKSKESKKLKSQITKIEKEKKTLEKDLKSIVDKQGPLKGSLRALQDRLDEVSKQVAELEELVASIELVHDSRLRIDSTKVGTGSEAGSSTVSGPQFTATEILALRRQLDAAKRTADGLKT